MTAMPLIEMLTSISALLSVLPWETCVLNLIEKQRPSSVFFVCTSADQCPSNRLYRMVRTPTQTIVGVETSDLPALKPSDLVFIVANKDFVLWGNETIEKYRTGGRNTFKAVVVANMSKKRDDDLVLMGSLFKAMWLSGVLNCVVLLANATSTELFTYFPFRRKESCRDATPVMLGTCYNVSKMIFDGRSKVLNLNECPIRVSLIDDRPFTIYPSGGRLIALIHEMSCRMNFTIKPITPDSGISGGACGQEEHTGTRGDVFAGRADMAVGTFIADEACSALEYVSFQYFVCFSWCTPVMSGSAYIYLVLIQPLQPSVWLSLVFTIVVVVLSVYFICSVTHDKMSLRQAISFFVIVFASVPIKPLSTPVRFVLGIWILSCVAIRAAYEGQLKSQSTLPLGFRIIHSSEELSEEDIQLCSSLSGLRMLKERNDPVIQMLHQKARACKGSIYENMVSASKFKDRGVFTTDLRCRVFSSGISRESSKLYPHTGGCFRRHQLSLVATTRGSPHNDRLKILQQRCIEAGLVKKWMDLKPIPQLTGEVAAYSLQHLLPALLILLVGWGSGCIVFGAEIAFYKWLIKDEIVNHIVDSALSKERNIKCRHTFAVIYIDLKRPCSM